MCRRRLPPHRILFVLRDIPATHAFRVRLVLSDLYLFWCPFAPPSVPPSPMSACNSLFSLSNMVLFFTRFTDEIFSLLISVIFIMEATKDITGR